MLILAVVAIVIACVIAGLIIVGRRSQSIITDPTVLSDKQIEATIELTRRILQRSRAGSPAWSRAAAAHKASIDEQLRRRGEQPFDNIELVPPPSS